MIRLRMCFDEFFPVVRQRDNSATGSEPDCLNRICDDAVRREELVERRAMDVKDNRDSPDVCREENVERCTVE